MSSSKKALVAKALPWLSLAIGLALTAVVVVVVVTRFRYPVQLEWMSGGVYEHVERVQQGKPLYAAPSLSYVPYIYPPLLYWLAAPLAKAFGMEVGCRILTTGCAVAVAFFVALSARALGASKKHAALATTLYVAAYPVSGYWYDLERADSVMMALVLAAVWLVLRFRSNVPAVVAAGALCGLAIFAKQPALLFALGLLGALALLRVWKGLVAFAASAALVCVPMYLSLQRSSGGWFSYYCWQMPSMHGMKTELLSLFFVADASKVLPFVAVTFAWGWVLVRILRSSRSVRARESIARKVVFGAALFAGYGAAMSGRLHAGGYVNVLMFWTTFAAIGLAVLASRAADASIEQPSKLFLAMQVAPLFAFMQFAFDPGEASPTAQRVVDARIVEERVRELETHGEVVVQGRGYLTRTRHFHIMALADVLRAGKEVPDDLRQALSSRRLAAYVVDEPGELYLEGLLGKKSELGDLILQNYFVAERLDDREPPPVVGWIAHPTWILRPRATPLSLTQGDLQRRMTIEMGLAESRMRQKQAGIKPQGEGLDIEVEANRLLATAPH